MSGHNLAVDMLRSESTGEFSASVTAEDVTGTLTSASQIPAEAQFVTATSANADYAIVLPAPIAGHQIWIQLNGSTACELRTPAASGNTINNLNSDGTKEAALVATNLYHCIATSSTGWVLRSFTKLGADEAAIVPN